MSWRECVTGLAIIIVNEAYIRRFNKNKEIGNSLERKEILTE